jgi:hypothetical protein
MQEAMMPEFGKKTWTPQQIPENVQGTKPRADREPASEPPKKPAAKK